MFQTNDRASFFILLFQFFQYYLLVLCPFRQLFYCNSFTGEENCIQNLLCTQRPFGNYWAFSVFSGQNFIANLSEGLKKWFQVSSPVMALQTAFCHKLRTLEAAYWTLTRYLFCSSVNRCGTHLAKIFRAFKCFFKIR